MNCPNCNTWNPDDKDVCWRCQTQMPRPVDKKPRKPMVVFGLPVWAWVVVLVIFFAPLLGQCFFVGPPPG